MESKAEPAVGNEYAPDHCQLSPDFRLYLFSMISTPLRCGFWREGFWVGAAGITPAWNEPEVAVILFFELSGWPGSGFEITTFFNMMIFGPFKFSSTPAAASLFLLLKPPPTYEKVIAVRLYRPKKNLKEILLMFPLYFNSFYSLILSKAINPYTQGAQGFTFRFVFFIEIQQFFMWI